MPEKKNLNFEEIKETPSGEALPNQKSSVHKKVEKALGSKDIFLENPPLQPKKDIAEYVEQAGFLVPRRFNSLREAITYLENGGEVVIRSEHPREYNGAAGLLKSFSVNLEELTKYEAECSGQECEIDWEDYLENPYTSSKVLKKILGKIRSENEMGFQDLMKKFCLGSVKRYCNWFKIT